MRLPVRTLPGLLAFASLWIAGDVFAGAWTQPAGTLWGKISVTNQTSDEFFARDGAVLPDGTVVEPGDARPYDESGESVVRQLWIDLEYGVTDRISVGLQAPWKRLEFENDVQALRTWGWGDVITRARFGLLTGATRLTVRGAWKAPTGRFSTRPDRIPIGENQHDLDIGLELGQSLGRPATWVNVDFGRRLRLRDDTLDFDPGDEWFGALEAGVAIDSRARWILVGRWARVRGDDESSNFLAPGTALARDLDDVEVKLLVDVGLTTVELALRWVVGSEGHPTAPTTAVGLLGEFRTR